MTDDARIKLGAPANRAPTDIPAPRPLALDPFDALEGVWGMVATFPPGSFGPDTPEITDQGGRTTFEWLDGRFFLIQRFENPHPAAPGGIAIIGPSHTDDGIVQHYYDSRGVQRVYHTSLENGTWKVWSGDSTFPQRYTGRFSPGGDSIEGAWEYSADGSEWTHDFALSYVRIT